MYAVRVFDESAPGRGFRPVRALFVTDVPDGAAGWFRRFDDTEPESSLPLDEAVHVALGLAKAGDWVQVVELPTGRVLIDTSVPPQLGAREWVDRFAILMGRLPWSSSPEKLIQLGQAQFLQAPGVWPEFRARGLYDRQRAAMSAEAD
jgi:hypothetical protein